MMDLTFTSVASKLASLVPDNQLRTCVLSHALAAVIADTLPIPTEAVVDSKNFFTMNNKVLAQDQVNKFNESLLIDVNKTLQMTESFWLLRYSIAYPSENVSVQRKLSTLTSFVDRFFVVDRYISPEDLSFLNEHAHAITMIACEIDTLMRD